MTSIGSAPAPPPGLRIHGTQGEGRGRSLRATRSFSPGDAIAVFNNPLLAIPDGPRSRFTCHWCLAPGVEKGQVAAQTPATPGPASTSPVAPGGSTADSGDASGVIETPLAKLSACSGCRYALYCSKNCQASGWRASHKLECPVFKRVFSNPGDHWIPTPIRAALQLLLRLGKGDKTVRAAVGDLLEPSEAGVDGGWLEGNVEEFKRDEKQWRDLGTQAVAAATYAGFDKLVGQPDLVRGVLCKIQTNAFDRSDPDTGAAGIFLDPVLAMANHSCIPNAFICFSGRNAILRAEDTIREGDEVEISYTDYTLSREARRNALQSYHFECQCPRCTDDLDVYQVCQLSPVLSLNKLSLQPDIQKLRSPPIERNILQSTSSSPAASANLPLDLRGALLEKQPPQARLETLRRWWVSCKPLIRARMFAVEPIPTILHELTRIYLSERHDYASALSLACFLATECHPYAHPAPFKPWRVKGMMLIANLLSQTAPLSMTGQLADDCPHRGLVACLSGCDQVSMCEALLRLVVRYGRMAHSADWAVLKSAEELLADIESLQGRQKGSDLLQKWISEPSHSNGRVFFEQMVLKPINELADFAIEISAVELG